MEKFLNRVKKLKKISPNFSKRHTSQFTYPLQLSRERKTNIRHSLASLFSGSSTPHNYSSLSRSLSAYLERESILANVHISGHQHHVTATTGDEHHLFLAAAASDDDFFFEFFGVSASSATSSAAAAAELVGGAYSRDSYRRYLNSCVSGTRVRNLQKEEEKERTWLLLPTASWVQRWLYHLRFLAVLVMDSISSNCLFMICSWKYNWANCYLVYNWIVLLQYLCLVWYISAI